jgi:lysophospholipase L1-like esterase
MEITVPKESFFQPLAVRKDKPVVVYGTSIAQGACATRPGLAWTNILARKLDRPVINLGFSGNGRLEKEVLDFIAVIDAKIYVLDCLPNLVGAYTENGELKKRLIAAVSLLQQKRPGIPILLTEHDGYTDEGVNPARKNDYQAANLKQRQVFDSLVAAGVKNIYLLSKEAINQDIESMVDGVHPNDIGMMHYAEAYDKKIRSILQETAGIVSTSIPITQRRDANTYDWETRHNAIIQYCRAHPPAIILIGNSITHFWGGEPASPRVNGINAWEKYFGGKPIVNMGFGWDRIENVLWRVYHGELDSIAPRQMVLMIGTNNLQYNNDQEIATGLEFLIKAIQLKQPAARILVMGIFPRRGMEPRVVAVNKIIAKMAAGIKLPFADAGPLFLHKDSKIDESLFSDGLHPNEAGYDKLGGFILQQLSRQQMR